MITIQKSFYQFTDVKDIKWYKLQTNKNHTELYESRIK